jgi:hypothetical protein
MYFFGSHGKGSSEIIVALLQLGEVFCVSRIPHAQRAAIGKNVQASERRCSQLFADCVGQRHFDLCALLHYQGNKTLKHLVVWIDGEDRARIGWRGFVLVLALRFWKKALELGKEGMHVANHHSKQLPTAQRQQRIGGKDNVLLWQVMWQGVLITRIALPAKVCVSLSFSVWLMLEIFNGSLSCSTILSQNRSVSVRLPSTWSA